MAYKPCKYLDVRGPVRITKNDVFACKYEPELPTFPAAVTKNYGFKWPPAKSYVYKDDCLSCPLYAPVGDE